MAPRLAIPRHPLALVGVLIAMVAGAVGCFTIDPVAEFFVLEVPPTDYLAAIAGVVAAGALVINVALRFVDHDGADDRRRRSADGVGLTRPRS